MAPLFLALMAALSVAIEEPRDPELARVISNQLADLPIERAPAATASVTVSLRAVRDGYEILVTDRRSGEQFVRHARGQKKDGRMKLSALREATALVIRGTLQALATGEEVPRDPPELVAEPEVDPPVEPEIPEEEESIWNSRRLYLGAGWSAGSAGDDLLLDQGPIVRGGFLFHGFEAALQLGISLPLKFSDEFTEISISRKKASGIFGRTLVDNQFFRLVVTFSAGAVHNVRRATARTEGVTISPAHTQLEPFAGFDLRFRLFSPLMFEASAGGEFYPRAPILTYVRDEQVVERAVLNTFQPRVGLAILFLTP